MDDTLREKIVLVTGAGKGTGRRIAKMLAQQGATLAVNDITPVNLDDTVAAIQSAGGRVRSYVADIAKKMPVQALIQDVVNDLGRLDILVNCAEVEPRLSALDMDDWDWQRTLDVNLTGAFLLTQVAGRVMREQGAGVIIHVGGRAHASDLRSAYFASKAGLEAFMQQASTELEDYGIRIHYVAPKQGKDVLEQILLLCSTSPQAF